MPDEIEIRPIRESEYSAAGEATARAFREFLTPDSPGWEAYLARIADIGSRVGRAVVLVAVEDGVIAGSVTWSSTRESAPGWPTHWRLTRRMSSASGVDVSASSSHGFTVSA